jgi:hypothetical protein
VRLLKEGIIDNSNDGAWLVKEAVDHWEAKHAPRIALPEQTSVHGPDRELRDGAKVDV